MFILPIGAPKRCAIFSARAVEPVPANILTEGFMGWLNVVQSYHSVQHLGNIIGSTFQQVIHLGENSIFFLVFIPL
jgi:hypothetical protein